MRSYAYPSGDPNGNAPTGPTARDLAIEAVALAGLAMCITLMFLSMRAVMVVGGACAEGGPYVIAQHCPTGSVGAMLLGMPGLFLFGGISLYSGPRVGGVWAGTVLLAWSGLFLALGWNFLDAGLLSVDPANGPEIGAIVCAVTFILMGAAPLVGMALMGVARINKGWGFGGQQYTGFPRRNRGFPGGEVSTPGGPRDLQGLRRVAREGRTAHSVPVIDAEMSRSLDRLAGLRDRGEISDAEYEAAKGVVLRPGGDPT
jgi:hypothetical protein